MAGCSAATVALTGTCISRLLHDTQFRTASAWQNTADNQADTPGASS
ncbi:hypothetical protein [Streptomyces lincolnensis]